MAKEVRIDPAPDIEHLASSLIQEFHPELAEVVVLYYLTTGTADCAPQKCNPKLRFGYSREVPGVVRAEVAAGPDFLVWVLDFGRTGSMVDPDADETPMTRDEPVYTPVQASLNDFTRWMKP